MEPTDKTARQPAATIGKTFPDVRTTSTLQRDKGLCNQWYLTKPMRWPRRDWSANVDVTMVCEIFVKVRRDLDVFDCK